MLYAKALREGLSELPTSTPEVRDKIGNLLKEKGLSFLYEALKKSIRTQPGAYLQTIHKRISRALEVYDLSGRPLTSFWRSKRNGVKYSDLCSLSRRQEKNFTEELPFALNRCWETGSLMRSEA